jgi:hypothetical protein
MPVITFFLGVIGLIAAGVGIYVAGLVLTSLFALLIRALPMIGRLVPKTRSAGIIGLYVGIVCLVAGFIWGFVRFGIMPMQNTATDLIVQKK